MMNIHFWPPHPYFTTLSKELFYKDFLTGISSQYCSPILVNAMLALGCHFSSKQAARASSDDSGTTGDHYFAEAKRLLYENEEFANAKLCTVQALALMSVREAGCGRESKGWVYSGMSFRMASDLGLNVDAPAMNDVSRLSAEDIDARRITFWGCFLFDKCWSNYLGRQPQLQLAHTNTKKFEVFPSEDSEMWSPYTDAGIVNTSAQPARTRAVALQISKLAEMSSNLLTAFYQPSLLEKPVVKQNELKKLTDLHTRLEAWKRDLPAEFEAKDGQKAVEITGEYKEVKPNEKLVYSWNWDVASKHIEKSDHQLTIKFEAAGSGSKINVTQENYQGDESVTPHAEGWEKALNDLHEYLSNKVSQ